MDEGATRVTPDVDLLIDRAELRRVTASLDRRGFVRAEMPTGPIFLDGPAGRPREAVHILFAGERVRPGDVDVTPAVADSEPAELFPVVTLASLVHMKLTSDRDQDRTHLRDMIDVGLIDGTWPARLPPVLGERLQALLDTPGR